MKLLSCHIENFGKLSGVDIDFKPGLNCIKDDNASGKTTLAAFLRVMFFGFDDEKPDGNRSGKERKALAPWGGGAFGGSVSFSAGDRSYVFTRVFREKRSQDTFELRDLTTNDISEDYDSSIGHELFGADRETFENTVFTGQDKSDVAGFLITDDIRKMAGDFSEETGDIDSSREAMDRLEERMNRLSPRKKTGDIRKKKDEAVSLQTQLKSMDGLEKNRQEYSRHLAELNDEKNEVNKKKSAASGKMALLDFRDIKNRISRISSDISHRNEEKKAALSVFCSRVPKDSEISGIIKSLADARTAADHHDALKLDGQEQGELAKLADRFSSGVPSEQETDDMISLDRKAQSEDSRLASLALSERDEQELKTLSEKMESISSDPASLDDMISAADYIQRLEDERKKASDELASCRYTLQELRISSLEAAAGRHTENAAGDSEKERYQRSVRHTAPYSVFAVIMLILAAVSGVTKASAAVTAIFALLAVICGICWFTAKRKGAVEDDSSEHSEADMTEVRSPDLEKQTQIQNRATELEKKIRNLESEIPDLDRTVKQYLKGLGSDQSSDYSFDLRSFREEWNRYSRLRSARDTYIRECSGSDSDALKEKVMGFLRRYYSESEMTEKTAMSLLGDLKGYRDKYLTLSDRNTRAGQACDTAQKIIKGALSFMEDTGMKTDKEISPDNLRVSIDTLQDIFADALERLKKAERLDSEVQALDMEKKSLEKKLEGRDLSGLDNVTESSEELSGIISELDQRTAGLESEIQRYRKFKDDLDEQTAELEEKQERLDILNRDIEQETRYYNLISIARETLESSVKALSARYSAPLVNAFSRYQSMITGSDKSIFHLDSNAKLTVDEQGSQRDAESMSAGLRDLYGLALRAALIEVMYSGEKPFVIMDDPFVNYDDRNLTGAMSFLLKYAEKYQVIYFTCHESREVHVPGEK